MVSKQQKLRAVSSWSVFAILQTVNEQLSVTKKHFFAIFYQYRSTTLVFSNLQLYNNVLYVAKISNIYISVTQYNIVQI